MSEKMSFEPPRGMRDFYPEDMQLHNKIFDAFKKSAAMSGFQQYDASVVESYDLLARKAGEEVGNQIYHFFDKSERHLALRAEMTPTLARMVAQRQKELHFPLKWTTLAQCFCYERMTKGRKREHYQWNVDIIGDNSTLAEAEVLGTAVNALKLLGFSSFDIKVHISSRKLLAKLLNDTGIPESKHQCIFLALDKRRKMPDEELAKMMKENELSDEEINKVFSIMSTTDYSSCPELIELFHYAKLMKFDDFLQFDISVIRGLSYYTGIVFEAFDVKKEFRAVFGGGRYDNLLDTIGGQSMSAVGLGFGDVVISEMLKARQQDIVQEKHGFAIGFMTDDQRDAAVKLATSYRLSNEHVDLSLHPMKAKKFFSNADSNNARYAVFIGPDDISNEYAKLKDMQTGEEKKIDLKTGVILSS